MWLVLLINRYKWVLKVRTNLIILKTLPHKMGSLHDCQACIYFNGLQFVLSVIPFFILKSVYTYRFMNLNLKNI